MKFSRFSLIILVIISFISCLNTDKETTNKQTGTYDIMTRAAWQKPSVVISKLGNISDKIIADIGAGTGYFSFRFAMKSKKVIAIDIDKDMLDMMELFSHNLPADIQAKFETRLAKPDNPKLKDKEVDIIVVINTFSYIKNREKYLKTIKNGLNDNGLLMILNFKKENISPDSPAKQQRIPLSVMKSELEQSGYSIKEIDTKSLEHQYIIIASI